MSSSRKIFQERLLLSPKSDKPEEDIKGKLGNKIRRKNGEKKIAEAKKVIKRKEKKQLKEKISIISEEQTIDDIMELTREYDLTKKNLISNFCELTYLSKNQKQTDLVEFWLEDGEPKERFYPGKKPLDPRTSPKLKCLEWFRNKDNHYTLSLIEIYQKLVDKFNEYIYHPNPLIIHLVVCGAIASYFPERFNTFPYFDFYGAEAECGKSTFLECLTYTSYYGHYVTEPSTAATFRVLNSFHCMMGIDELGKLLTRKDGKTYLSILLSGYRKGGVVSRCNENDFDDIKFFEVFGVKAWSRLEWLPRELVSRAITIIMMKNEGRKQLKDNLTLSDFDDIRNDLYNCRLFYQYEVRKTYDELLNLKELYDRNKELFLPILTIAKIVDTTIYYEILEYAKMIQKEKKNTSMDNWLILLMEVLYHKPYSGEVILVDIRNDFREALVNAGEINNDDKGIKKITSQAVLSRLQRLGFKKAEKRVDNRVCVDISKKIFEHQAFVYLKHIEELQQAISQQKLEIQLSSHESNILSISKNKDKLPPLEKPTKPTEPKGRNESSLSSLSSLVQEVGEDKKKHREEALNTPEKEILGLREGLEKPIYLHQIHIFIERQKTATFEELEKRFKYQLTLEEIKFLVNELVEQGELLLDKDLISIPIESIGEVKGK